MSNDGESAEPHSAASFSGIGFGSPGGNAEPLESSPENDVLTPTLPCYRELHDRDEFVAMLDKDLLGDQC